jgi:tetratricopeptide (TPR) repeat protein
MQHKERPRGAQSTSPGGPVPGVPVAIALGPEYGPSQVSATVSRGARTAGPVPDGRHHLLIPLSVLLSAALLYGARLPFGAVLAVAAVFLALYLAAPWLSRRSREAFDRDALAIRARAEGRGPALEARLARAWALRLFGAPADVHARRGMIAEEAGRPRAARDHYKRALEAWQGEPPLATLAGYARASYECGDDVEAVVSLQKLVDRGTSLPRLHVRLAHATLRAALPTESVGPWLDQAEREAHDENGRAEVALVRALSLAAKGDAKAARRALEEAPLPDGAPDRLRALRDEVKDAIERA